MDESGKHLQLQAVLTILRHLGRLSEVHPITIRAWLTAYTCLAAHSIHAA